jgi:Putative type VII ESX secretion system translocon, EccE
VSQGRLTYRFGPLERRGLIGPVRTGQAAAVGLGALAAVALLDQLPSTSGAALAIVVFGGAVALANAPVAGRTLDEWAPLAASFALRRIAGRARFRSPISTRGESSGAAGSSQPVVPPALRGARIVEVAYRDRPLGAVSERGGRWLTAVLACRVEAFSLLDADAQERRLARWGLVLSTAASTPIRRIQWVERTAPAQGDELARWLHAERDPAVPLRGTPMIESYLELIGSTARVTQQHEVLLAIQLDARRVRERGADAGLRALIDETERVAQGLEAAEVTVAGALSARQLARALRTAFDPYVRAQLTALETADPGRDGLAEHNAWPLGAEEAWEHYRSDGALHTTYWIAGWPRIDVSPMFMDALLGRSSTVRTVAVTFEPVQPGRSTREVEAAITRDQADQELRRRFGQSETARQRQAREATTRREAELAAGHAEVRLSGFVTVSARDRDDLRRASAEVLEHAARARLELHCMYGQQAEAFTFTLPLCRGLR